MHTYTVVVQVEVEAVTGGRPQAEVVAKLLGDAVANILGDKFQHRGRKIGKTGDLMGGAVAKFKGSTILASGKRKGHIPAA